jgi:hypothetical protein
MLMLVFMSLNPTFLGDKVDLVASAKHLHAGPEACPHWSLALHKAQSA